MKEVMQGWRSEQNDTKDHRKGEDALNLYNITYKLRFVGTNTIKIMYLIKKLVIILKKILGFKRIVNAVTDKIPRVIMKSQKGFGFD